ncbi:MAG: hypothetical protein NC818_03530, partial [Candidatus Omnitrophica bacterium]|nr:hypothetical protein [Candidatus Omnitrophota bacterium]
WQLVTREVDKETAKRKLLDLIKNESKLEQIDIALDLFTQYYASPRADTEQPVLCQSGIGFYDPVLFLDTSSQFFPH